MLCFGAANGAYPGAGGAPRNCTPSMGVSELRATDSFHDLMQRADAALYRAKQGGRDRVVCDAA